MEFDPLLEGGLDLEVVGRHLRAAPAIVNGHRPGAHPESHPRRVDRHVPAADDGHPLSGKVHPPSGVSGGKHLHRLQDARELPPRHLHPLPLHRAQGEERRVEPLVVQGGDGADGCAGPDLHPQGGDIPDVPVHQLLGEPERRDAVAQHPAGLGPAFEHRDAVPPAREEVRGGQPRRPGADDGDRFPVPRFRRTVLGLGVPLVVGIDHEPLDPADGHLPLDLVPGALPLARRVARAA